MKRKQFKLIKKYPGSAPLNTVYEELYDMKSKLYRRIGKDNKAIDESWILDNPEFWEEIKEPGYEILTVLKPCVNLEYKLIKYSQLGTYIGNVYCHNGSKITEFEILDNIENKNWKINSVKRLNDNQIFTIGNKVTYNSHPPLLTVNRFKLENNKIFIEYVENKNKWFDDWICDNVKVVKSIFTTYDNVDIFAGDPFYIINKNDFTWNTWDTWDVNNREFKASEKTINAFKTCDLIFSSKDKAEEYILHHKPLFTLEDVIHQNLLTEEERCEFYKLAKERLNE